MDAQLIRVRYYQGNVYLATAVNFKPLLSAQDEGSFEGAARAVTLRRFGDRPTTMRRATAEEAATDPTQEPSARVSRGLIEQRYYVVTVTA